MLPGADRVRTADPNGIAALPCLRNIGDQSIGRPVAAADHVSRPGARDRYAPLAKERTSIGRDDDLACRLASGIRIVAAERIVLPVWIDPFAVGVDFVGRDHDRDLHLGEIAQRFEHMRCTEDVGRECLDRRLIAAQDERLSGEVKHDLRLRPDDPTARGLEIANLEG